MTIQYIYYTDNIRLCKNGDVEKKYKKNNEWNILPNNSYILINDTQRSKNQLYKFCFNHQFGLPLNGRQRTINWKFYEDNNIDY